MTQHTRERLPALNPSTGQLWIQPYTVHGQTPCGGSLNGHRSSSGRSPSKKLFAVIIATAALGTKLARETRESSL